MKRLNAYLNLYLGLLLYFLLFRIVFTLSNDIAFDFSAILGLPTLRLDSALSAYFIAALILLSGVIYLGVKSQKNQKRIYYWFFFIILIGIGIIELSSISLYKDWGTTVDARVLSYLGHKEAWLTTISSLNVPIIIGMISLLICSHLISNWWSNLFANSSNSFWQLLVIPLLIIPARGGLQKIPIDTSSVFTYQSLDQNYVAVNKPYLFVKSLLSKYKHSSNFNGASLSTYIKPIDHPIYKKEDIAISPKPNVVFILLEGLPHKLLHMKESGAEITPNLNNLLPQSLVFDSIFSTGFRTDQGLLSIYSGIPALPHINMMNDLEKVHSAPSLLKDLKSSGYRTSFFYGGDLNFSEMSKYLINQQVDKIISVNDFDKPFCDWGKQDDEVFDRMSSFLAEEQQPFCSNILTLLSHQPFDYIGYRKFGDKTTREKFLSSAYYLDSLVGNFISNSKHKTWYDNTLFVILSDHGSVYTGDVQHNEYERFHIPLMIFGAPLNQDKKGHKISTIGSHHDLAQTLSYILNLPINDYKFSSNLFNPKDQGRAYWFTEFEMGYMADSSQVIYNFKDKNLAQKSGLLKTARAVHQAIEQEYLWEE